ncbi:uncharacterized protein A4U43_UnF310 [Asparagus officinalis]|uniref:Uncharacterized protein n=1 Tax=Asparagus officinalis TaxID=4686 RepID=A0A1R3L7U0_ASPOF|nr:uncharacterized protein A4U43_UnF310 [Asparagus officinalis]
MSRDFAGSRVFWSQTLSFLDLVWRRGTSGGVVFLALLSSKSLIRRYPCVNNRDLSTTESKFCNEYVAKYMDQVPEDFILEDTSRIAFGFRKVTLFEVGE